MKNTFLTLFILSFTVFLFAQNEPQDLTGTKAQEFELVDINGNIISSKSTKGKVVVLNFWYVGCKPCLKEIPELNTVYKKYVENPDVIFASITYDNLERVKKKLSKYNIEYPIVVDGNEACQSFRVNGFPTNIVIDRKGNYYFRFTGGFSGIGDLISASIQKALVI
ncbi:MAG: TlpA disulfide reductase family protein [Bacteroidota bacterium]